MLKALDQEKNLDYHIKSPPKESEKEELIIGSQTRPGIILNQ